MKIKNKFEQTYNFIFIMYNSDFKKGRYCLHTRAHL